MIDGRARRASRTSASPSAQVLRRRRRLRGNVGLHGAGAVPRDAGNGAERPVRAGPHPLRDLHRKVAIQGRVGAGVGTGAYGLDAIESLGAGVEIEPAVDRAILRCLEKDPTKRPASAAQVAAALPGGDPLAAALAAGETPSPELVAASGEEGTLPRAKAWLWLAACLIALAVVPFTMMPFSLAEHVALDLSPDALQTKAREVLQQLGIPTSPLIVPGGSGSTTSIWSESTACGHEKPLTNSATRCPGR